MGLNILNSATGIASGLLAYGPKDFYAIYVTGNTMIRCDRRQRRDDIITDWNMEFYGDLHSDCLVSGGALMATR